MALKPVLPSGLVNIPKTTFLSTNVARVDPNGDDASGKVADLTRPFKTVAAAIAALEALTPGAANCVILVNGDFSSEDVTTSLQALTFIGNGNYGSTAFHSLTLTEASAALEVMGVGVVFGTITATNSNHLVVDISQAGIANGVTNTGGATIVVFGPGASGAGPANQFTVTSDGPIFVNGFTNYDDLIDIAAAGQNITALTSILNDVTATNVTMNDSRFKPGGTLNITGTITYANALLDGLRALNPLPVAPTDIAGIIQTLADMGAWQQPL